jgi:serine/threonine protein kinase
MDVGSASVATGAGAGTVFAGRYRLIHLLGEGDRKRTYLAEDTVVGRQVALAIIKPEAAGSDPRGATREVEALCQTGRHDNIVTLYDRGIAEGVDYLVFEYLSGGNLRDFLTERKRKRKGLSVDELRRLGRQLARALAHVHARGLLHRDVAPANIWLDERQMAHLGDFDSAIPKGVPAEDKLPPTTEAYASPEEVAGKPTDERSDLYSLGAVLYEALTGEAPRRSGKGAVVAPRVLRPDTPADLNTVICRLMAPRQEDRPASAEELLQELKPPFAKRRPEGLFPWAEGLPFPLTSILWLYDAQPDARPKLDHLLNFFEALAEFRSTVLISGFLTDRALFDAGKPKWFGWDSGPGLLKLETGSFGTWVELSERMSETARQLQSDPESAERCYGLFAAQDRDLIDAITGSDLTRILLAARDRRNAVAHGGILGRQALGEELHNLGALLTRTQNLLATGFETWTLLRPGPATYAGGVFDLTATLLTGTNPAFRKAHIQMSEPLDARRLHLLNGGSRHALELVPLIQVMPAPKIDEDTCYFYSRMQRDGAVRWVSYHSVAEPELILDDADVAKLIAETKLPDVTSPET